MTVRLEEAEIAELDAAIAAGAAPDRASAVEEAVREWLERNDRGRIAESYREAYERHPLTDEETAAIKAASRRTALDAEL